MNQLQLSVVNQQVEIETFIKSGCTSGFNTGETLDLCLSDKLHLTITLHSNPRKTWISPWLFIKNGENYWEDSTAYLLGSLKTKQKNTDKIIGIVSHQLHQAVLNQLSVL